METFAESSQCTKETIIEENKKTKNNQMQTPKIIMNDGKKYVSKCVQKKSKKSKKYNKTLKDLCKKSDNLATIAEGQISPGEYHLLLRADNSEACVSSKLVGIENSLAIAQKPTQREIMERADLNPYSSDEWEYSDTDGDHTDSSDDDDPKSQVDRLIERGAQMYIDAENSALSSNDESDYDSDSESDITDVSPITSACASPLKLSPIMPRRITTSPLALHSHSNFLYQDQHQTEYEPDQLAQQNLINTDTHNMELLFQTVLELENKPENANKRIKNKSLQSINENKFLHPIRSNPRHHHLRKNMSFNNEEVRQIDRENEILLKKLVEAHTRSKPHFGCNKPLSNRPPTKSSNSAINRKRAEERIRRENVLLLKKIQDAKPSKESNHSHHDSEDYYYHCRAGSAPQSISRSNSSHQTYKRTDMRSPTGSSCGAFMRSIEKTSHVAISPARKEMHCENYLIISDCTLCVQYQQSTSEKIHL